MPHAEAHSRVAPRSACSTRRIAAFHRTTLASCPQVWLLRCVACCMAMVYGVWRRALIYVLNAPHRCLFPHQNLSHNAISRMDALKTASADCFEIPESIHDRAAYSKRIQCGPKFPELASLDMSHNELISVMGALEFLFVPAEELSYVVATSGGNNVWVDPPSISMPIGFGASLTFLDVTSNPGLAPVKEPASGLELMEKRLLPESVGRAAPSSKGRSTVRCDILQYHGTHAGPVPTQDASDLTNNRWVDLVPSPNISLDIPVDPGWMSYWHCMSPRKTQPRFSDGEGLLATATELRRRDDDAGYS